MDTDTKTYPPSWSRILPLWTLVFFTGWFIMQTELVGARALTPFFGNSIYVWGSVIAVFLLALALGYGAGGRLTRRYQSHWLPAVLLVLAGGLVALSVLYQNGLCNSFATKMDVRWGALLGSIILYAIPMILAGTISPYAVHLATASKQEAGSRAGTLYAVSTIGSFIGSLVTSFLLIPSYSLQGVALGGGVLVAAAAVVAALGLTVGGRASWALSLGFTAIALTVMTYSPHHIVPMQQQVYTRSIIGEKLSDAPPSTLSKRLADAQAEATKELKKYASAPPDKETVLYSIETAYHRVQVTQKGAIRKLTFGEAGFKIPQTTMNLNDITASVAEYAQIMLAPILYKQDMKRALIIGLGGADIARKVEMCYPDIVLDVVEIDPAVVNIARDYFFWKPSRNVTAYTMDGRSFVNLHVVTKGAPYDWIIVDAFDNDFVPFHMTTVEFYMVLRRIMAPDAVLAVNTRIDHELYSYQARTLQAAFAAPGSGQVDVYMPHRAGNMILVAQNDQKGPMTLERALAARKKVHLPANAPADLKYITSCLLPRPNWDTKGDVLSDMWAPVERLMQIR